MRFWAGLGFSTGLAGVALLSACSTKELLAPTPAVFTAPQKSTGGRRRPADQRVR